MEFNAQEQALIQSINEQTRTLFAEKTKGLISDQAFKDGLSLIEKQIEDKANAMNALQKTIDNLNEVVENQGTLISKMEAIKGDDSKHMDLEKELHKHKDSMLQAAKQRTGMAFKTEYTRASVTSNPMGMMLPEIGLIGSPIMSVYDSLPKIPVAPESNGVVRYIDQTLGTRNAATRDESTTYPESAIAFQGYTLDLEKIGDTIPITEESIKFTSRLAAEVEMFLQTNVKIVTDTQLMTGDNNPPNLNGLYTAATTYTATAADIVDASIYDLIMKVRESITGNTTYGGKYLPDVCYMNISDINKYRLKKDANYNYIIPPFGNREGTSIGGVTVIECPQVTANTLVLGDRRFARIYEEPGIEFTMGYSGEDFKQDVITLKVRRYLALLVRNADVTGWRKVTDITDACSTLAQVS